MKEECQDPSDLPRSLCSPYPFLMLPKNKERGFPTTKIHPPELGTTQGGGTSFSLRSHQARTRLCC